MLLMSCLRVKKSNLSSSEGRKTLNKFVFGKNFETISRILAHVSLNRIRHSGSDNKHFWDSRNHKYKILTVQSAEWKSALSNSGILSIFTLTRLCLKNGIYWSKFYRSKLELGQSFFLWLVTRCFENSSRWDSTSWDNLYIFGTFSLVRKNWISFPGKLC